MSSVRIFTHILVTFLISSTVWAGSPEELIIGELNFARTQPAEYATFLEQHKALFVDPLIFQTPDGSRIVTSEGTAAVDEAIDFLRNVKPVMAFKPSLGLTKAALDHNNDTGPLGLVGHQGSDGSSPFDRMKRHGQWKISAGENISYGHEDPRQIVIQLIVDDGISNRGHRANIFEPKFQRIGVAVGQHKVYGFMCTMDFAGGFKEKED